jgi:nitrate/nitrite-specific signal transduction histidine kinase
MEEDLREVKDDLEIRVRERTREIEKANSAL